MKLILEFQAIRSQAKSPHHLPLVRVPFMLPWITVAGGSLSAQVLLLPLAAPLQQAFSGREPILKIERVTIVMGLSNRRWDVKHVIASRRRCRVHGCLRVDISRRMMELRGRAFNVDDALC